MPAEQLHEDVVPQSVQVELHKPLARHCWLPASPSDAVQHRYGVLVLSHCAHAALEPEPMHTGVAVPLQVVIVFQVPDELHSWTMVPVGSQRSEPCTHTPVHTPLRQVEFTQGGPACVVLLMHTMGALPEDIDGTYVPVLHEPWQTPFMHTPGHVVVSLHALPSGPQVCTTVSSLGLQRCVSGAQTPHPPMPLQIPFAGAGHGEPAGISAAPPPARCPAHRRTRSCNKPTVGTAD